MCHNLQWPCKHTRAGSSVVILIQVMTVSHPIGRVRPQTLPWLDAKEGGKEGVHSSCRQNGRPLCKQVFQMIKILE